MSKGIVEDLCERVHEAQEILLKSEITANTVILNGNKYGKLMRPGCKPSIFGMAVKFENLRDDTDFVVMREVPKPQTNADKIRSMTDEELAEYLANICYDPWNLFVEDPKKEWLDWLQEEASSD